MDIFKDEFVPNIEGQQYHPKWVRSNPGEADKWATFRDAVIAHKKGGAAVAVPSLATKYGKALIAAGKEHMSVTDLGSVYTPPVIPPPTTEPAPIAGQGYSIVFEDQFATLNTNVWRLANWYEPEQPSDVFVSNGVMNVVSRSSQGNPPRGAMTKAGYSWQKGYFECRLRWTYNVNAFPAFWMMSENWITTGNCNTLKVSEWDIFEAFADVYFPRDHSGNLRRNTNDGCGLANSDHMVRTFDSGFVLAGQWRTYAGLWTDNNVYYYVDDTLLGGSATWDTTAQKMRLFLQMSSHAAAGVDLVSEYDWVRVWQKP